MPQKKKNTARRAGLLLSALFFLCVCAEDEAVIRMKLDIILASDLEAILEGVDEAALLNEPYFVLLDYRHYDEGVFSRMAIVDFFFLRPFGGMTAKITRKFRYHKRMGMWDRYYNQFYRVPYALPEEGDNLSDNNGADNNIIGQ